MFRRDGAAGDQPAAADRHHQRVQVRDLTEHFQGDRALTGDDEGIVKGVDEDEPLALGELLRVLGGPASASPCRTTRSPW